MGGAKQCALVARGKSMPRMGILIDFMSFMSTHIDFLLILRLGEKCARYLKLPDTRMPDKRDFNVLDYYLFNKGIIVFSILCPCELIMLLQAKRVNGISFSFFNYYNL